VLDRQRRRWHGEPAVTPVPSLAVEELVALRRSAEPLARALLVAALAGVLFSIAVEPSLWARSLMESAVFALLGALFCRLGAKRTLRRLLDRLEELPRGAFVSSSPASDLESGRTMLAVVGFLGAGLASAAAFHEPLRDAVIGVAGAATGFALSTLAHDRFLARWEAVHGRLLTAKGSSRKTGPIYVDSSTALAAGGSRTRP
jgi:hypothetical protein